MYLDPGVGSMLIQVLIASFAAIAVGFGIFCQRIKALFIKDKNDEISSGLDVDVLKENSAAENEDRVDLNDMGDDLNGE